MRGNRMIAFMNVRLSLAGRPPLGEPSSGRKGSGRCRVSSEMSVWHMSKGYTNQA